MNIKPNKGDKVVITDQSLDHIYGKEFVVVRPPGVNLCRYDEKRVWLVDQDRYGNNYGSAFFVYISSCELVKPMDKGVSKMESLIPKPGDTIVITNPDLPSFQKQFVVLTPPEKHEQLSAEGINGRVWVNKQDDPLSDPHLSWFYLPSCQVIKTRTTESDDSVAYLVCPDCRGKGVVQLFTTTVKCKLCNRE